MGLIRVLRRVERLKVRAESLESRQVYSLGAAQLFHAELLIRTGVHELPFQLHVLLMTKML